MEQTLHSWALLYSVLQSDVEVENDRLCALPFELRRRLPTNDFSESCHPLQAHKGKQVIPPCTPYSCAGNEQRPRSLKAVASIPRMVVESRGRIREQLAQSVAKIVLGCQCWLLLLSQRLFTMGFQSIAWTNPQTETLNNASASRRATSADAGRHSKLGSCGQGTGYFQDRHPVS